MARIIKPSTDLNSRSFASIRGFPKLIPQLPLSHRSNLPACICPSHPQDVIRLAVRCLFAAAKAVAEPIPDRCRILRAALHRRRPDQRELSHRPPLIIGALIFFDKSAADFAAIKIVHFIGIKSELRLG